MSRPRQTKAVARLAAEQKRDEKKLFDVPRFKYEQGKFMGNLTDHLNDFTVTDQPDPTIKRSGDRRPTFQPRGTIMVSKKAIDKPTKPTPAPKRNLNVVLW